MRLGVHAVGRMKSGPERDLADRYADRFRKAGSALGLDHRGVIELVESRAPSVDERRRDEAERLAAGLPDGAAVWCLDETGRTVSSPEFAESLASLRDSGVRDLALLIGGPDGFDRDLLGRADRIISFGRMTWPHQLVRVMLAEQLYRAATILSGHPYHRN